VLWSNQINRKDILKIILPKTLVDPASIIHPLYFLAGPVQGGGDWQQHACNTLHYRLGDKFTVVVPNRWNQGHPLYQYKMVGDERHFCRQTLWERHYLREAAFFNGCILFWLPRESKDTPRNDGSPYARDTYGELGEWRGILIDHRTLPVVIGAEEGFPGLSVIKENFKSALREALPIYDTLDATTDAAIKKALGIPTEQ
jgi:hypothetical protein